MMTAIDKDQEIAQLQQQLAATQQKLTDANRTIDTLRVLIKNRDDVIREIKKAASWISLR